MTNTTATDITYKPGDRVASTLALGYIGSTGTVQYDHATINPEGLGKVRVAWDDDTYCAVSRSEIRPLAPADDRILAAHFALLLKAITPARRSWIVKCPCGAPLHASTTTGVCSPTCR